MFNKILSPTKKISSRSTFIVELNNNNIDGFETFNISHLPPLQNPKRVFYVGFPSVLPCTSVEWWNVRESHTKNTFFKFTFPPVSSFPLGTQQMSLLCTQKGVKVFNREESRKKAAGRSCAKIPSISLKQTKLKQTKGKLSKESV